MNGREARFLSELEQIRRIEPEEVQLEADSSSGFEDTKLFLEGAFRSAPPTGTEPLLKGQAAIDDLAFQQVPVRRALEQPRVRLLIADDVGLGKTLEAGLVTSELILRNRARRILVVTTRAMLAQFQKEFWTRFAIPLARLDGNAIKRMRNRIPAHYNVFDQFERVIVSIDTLKGDLGIRTSLEKSRWNLVIIDEAHNAARRRRTQGSASLRARLAELLSRQTDSLLLLTATPHDGSQESFASLVEMLDPARIPDPSRITRADIDDLVVRRFRNSDEVVADLEKHVPERSLECRSFRLSPDEDEACRMIADLRLDMDDDGKKRPALDLFRTTLAKAMFSSPMACLQTARRRLDLKRDGTSRNSEGDRRALGKLVDQLQGIDAGNFEKYLSLRQYLRELNWDGKDPRDRIVIFSERLKTLSFLESQLVDDLGLDPSTIGRVDGGSLEADREMQKTLEDFGQKQAKIRILLASDMASEGLNLHFQCHRLIHFDLPWSLIRFQQRNGRIDRYGQDRQPQIVYFVGESSHEKVRDMWVLEKLVEKDLAAQKGVDDPAVFLGVGDAEGEEEVVAEAVASGEGADRFEELMDRNVAERQSRAGSAEESPEEDKAAILFGAFMDDAETIDYADASEPGTRDSTTAGDRPRLYDSTFNYAANALGRLAREGKHRLLAREPEIDPESGVIRFEVPESMKATDNFGYSSSSDVDDRYMPREAVTKGKIVLTDSRETMNADIENARFDERAWPEKQYLWDIHPVLKWLYDGTDQLFERGSAPLCRLPESLESGQVAVLLHGAISNRVGTPIVDSWGIVRVTLRDQLDFDVGRVERVEDFFRETGFGRRISNRGNADPDTARDALGPAIAEFRRHLLDLRSERFDRLEEFRIEHEQRLAEFKRRFSDKLVSDFGEAVEDEGRAVTIQDRRRRKRREERERKIRDIFEDWENWFQDNCEIVEESSPHVEVKAVFQG